MKYLKEFSKKLAFLMLIILSFQITFAAVNVIDVQIQEYVHEETTYNPLVTGSGQYFDTNEQNTVYVLNGTITVVNNHPTEAAENIILNLSNVGEIYNLTYNSGSTGFIVSQNSTNIILAIPDLGAGNISTFTYDINSTNVAPPINVSTTYSDSKVFAGLPITVFDSISNDLGVLPDTCIYNISVIQDTIPINQSGVMLNYTFDSTSIAGTDSANVVISNLNQTSTWNVIGGGCLNRTNSTDVNYNIDTPAAVNVASSYNMTTSKITYNFNATFSQMSVQSIKAMTDLDLNFDKYLNQTLTGDNATWQITAQTLSQSDISVNLTTVTLWVSTRNGAGGGFTNPAIRDNDTISGADLIQSYNPNVILNSTQSPWDNLGNEWMFNYTFSASPIVWMDVENTIINDGIQLTNQSISYGNNSIYIKQLYLATGYWLEITKNITRLSDNNYNVFVTVINRGTSPTPADQAVQVYNFLPNTFTLTSALITSSSTWYNTVEANQTLSDPTYNGTMYQFALMANANPSNSSLDSYGTGSNINNTWTLSYNVSGSGQFNFDDLFLTGVDPLNVGEVGGTQAVTLDSVYGFISSKVEYSLGIVAISLAALLFFL